MNWNKAIASAVTAIVALAAGAGFNVEEVNTFLMAGVPLAAAAVTYFVPNKG